MPGQSQVDQRQEKGGVAGELKGRSRFKGSQTSENRAPVITEQPAPYRPNPKLKRVEAGVESLIFNSRWLMAPFYIGLVMFSGYENFVSKIDPGAHPEWPEWMSKIDYTSLKQKLLGSIVAISATWPMLMMGMIQLGWMPTPCRR